MSVQDIYQSVLSMNDLETQTLVRKELDRGTSVADILNLGLISALDEVGRRFGTGEMFLPEMLMAARAMQAGLEIIRPLLTEAEAKSAGTVVLGTVKGDLHDIGKNIVGMMLVGAGFKVFDLGVDVAPEIFIKEINDKKADILALSALLTTTMPAMKATVEAAKKASMPVKIIIGGAPVSQAFAEEIGADGYGADAPDAVILARKLITA